MASELEQRIVMEDYGYPARQVPITGFARFDALFAATERPPRSVLVMPTWREVMRTDELPVERLLRQLARLPHRPAAAERCSTPISSR